jgi:ElaB/YqjD/DUF883 family membrane-anchored ribosome-binding protein
MANQPTMKGTEEKFADTLGVEKGKVEEKVSELKEAGRNVVEDVREGAREGADNVKSILTGKAKNLMDQAGENWENVREGAGQAVKNVRKQTTAAVGNVSSAVRQHPFQALIVGFGIGALLGAAISRSRRA